MILLGTCLSASTQNIVFKKMSIIRYPPIAVVAHLEKSIVVRLKFYKNGNVEIAKLDSSIISEKALREWIIEFVKSLTVSVECDIQCDFVFNFKLCNDNDDDVCKSLFDIDLEKGVITIREVKPMAKPGPSLN
jgi:hypothetical protein